MKMFQLIAAVIAILALLSIGTAFFSWLHSFYRRAIKNQMRRTENIKQGAKVVSVTPQIHKTNGIGYISADVIVDFSDGSYYCAPIGHTSPYRTIWRKRGTLLSYSENDLRDVVYEAVKAHEELARRKH